MSWEKRGTDTFGSVPAVRARGEVLRLLDGGMSPSEIAQAANLRPSYVSQLRSGVIDTNVRIEVVTKLKAVPTPPRPIAPDPMAWQERAACLGHPTDWWYLETANDGRPGGHEAAALADARRAVEICDGCPVRDECLTYALGHEKYGIWGGLNANERRRLKRRQRDARREP